MAPYQYTQIEAPKTSPNKAIHISKFNKLAEETPEILVGKHIFEYHPDTENYTYRGKYYSTSLTAKARLQDLLADYAAHVVELSLNAIKKYASLPKSEFAKQQTERYLEEILGQPWKKDVRGGEMFIQSMHEHRGKYEKVEDMESFFATITDYLEIRNKINPAVYNKKTFDFSEDVREMFDLLKENMSIKYSKWWASVFRTHMNESGSDLSLEDIVNVSMDRFVGGEDTEEDIAWWQFYKEEHRDILVYFRTEDHEKAAEQETEEDCVPASDDLNPDNVESDEGTEADINSNEVNSDESTTLIGCSPTEVEEPQEVEVFHGTMRSSRDTLRNWATRTLRTVLQEYYPSSPPTSIKGYMRWCEDILALRQDELTTYIETQLSRKTQNTMGTSTWVLFALGFMWDDFDFATILEEDHEKALRHAYRGITERLCPWNGDAGHRYLPALARMPHQQPGERTRRALRWERIYYDEMMGVEQGPVDETLQENRRPTSPPPSREGPQESWPMRVLLQGDEQRRQQRLDRERQQLDSRGAVLQERMLR